VDINPHTNPEAGKFQAAPGMTPAEASAAAHRSASLAEQKRHHGVTEANAAATAERGKALTEAQGNATGFGLRARRSADIINELEDNDTFGKFGTFNEGVRNSLERIPVIGTAAGGLVGSGLNKVTSDAQQKYVQAKGDFKRAVLRKESGATISPAEDQAADIQYFPQAGDSDAVIKQKRENRESAIESLGIQAGPGAKSITSQPGRRRAAGAINPSNLSDEELKRELGL